MPELPDVESFKRYLDATSLHQRIAHVDVLSAYVLKDISARELAHRLKGRCFESSRRHGKHLFVRTDGDVWLRLHFGMTGSLRYFRERRRTRGCFSFLPEITGSPSTISASLAKSDSSRM
jgi:formamidopyrimidine-DNA glycosylase